MAHYSQDGETANIMALAPVIPVLTVQSVEDDAGGSAAKMTAKALRSVLLIRAKFPSPLVTISERRCRAPTSKAGCATSAPTSTPTRGTIWR